MEKVENNCPSLCRDMIIANW